MNIAALLMKKMSAVGLAERATRFPYFHLTRFVRRAQRLAVN